MTAPDDLQRLMTAVADGQFTTVETGFVPDSDIDPSIYLACFSTPAGKMVLRDLFRRYCDTSRWVPGEAKSSGFYREGMAQVVYEIAAHVETAASGEETESLAETE